RIARYTGNAAKAARLPNNRGAMNVRWRARMRTSGRAEGCTSASRQSRMILNTVTAHAPGLVRQSDAPQRPLVVGATCQTEIKRTVRRNGLRRNALVFAEVSNAEWSAFGADGE